MNQYVDVDYQNPHAASGLKLALQLISNTPDEDIDRNIRTSSVKYQNWLQYQEPHDGTVVLIGGGDSVNDHVEQIKELQSKGALVIAMNGSSKWARNNWIWPDIQVIVDAKEETADLVDPDDQFHVFASQCDAKTLKAANNLTLFHLIRPNIEELLPADRVSKGGYVLVGGDATVGICSLCVAYTQGFRDFHIFGYDSSHRSGKSHAYHQMINNNMPTMEIEHGGKTFISSIAMSKQPGAFISYTEELKKVGCKISVYGDGLLQTIYNTEYEDLSERDKYQLMWMFDAYRRVAPGEHVVDKFIEICNPDGLVIDYGCGTGRAGIKLNEKGIDVLLMDFAVNCRDDEAFMLPFMKHDLKNPIPTHSPYGFCTDVMEHIPTEQVGTVIDNIMNSAGKVFFQISTVNDLGGDLIGESLHLTVHPYIWWKDLFIISGYEIEWSEEQDLASLFYVINPDRRDTCQ